MARHQYTARYSVNHQFFSTINNEHNAYLLGLIAADGHLMIKKRTLMIGLQQSDADYLTHLRSLIRSTAPIRCYTTTSHGKPYRSALMQITSKQITDDLMRHGIVKNKTQHLSWPTTVPDHLLRHYVRGFVDGDGSFYVERHGQPVFSVGALATVAVGMSSFLTTSCGLKPKPLQYKITPAGHAFTRIQYVGRHVVTQIFHLLYDDSTVWMPRKRAIIEPILCPYCTRLRCSHAPRHDGSTKLDREDKQIIFRLVTAGVPRPLVALGFEVSLRSIRRTMTQLGQTE